MKTYHTVLLTAVLLLAFYGCKKEDDAPGTPPGNQPLVKSYYREQNGFVSNTSFLYYDQEGRILAKVDSASNGPVYTSLYTYNGLTATKIYGTGTDTANWLVSNFVLDSNGRNALATYDAEGHLLSNGNSTYDYLWTDGNLTGIFVNDTLNTTFTYYTGHPNTIGYQNTGEWFYGTDSKNPLKQQVNAAGNVVLSYTYTYDADGRIATQTGISGQVTHYTYF